LEKEKGNPPCQWVAFSRNEGFEHAFILSAIPNYSLINFELLKKMGRPTTHEIDRPIPEK